jgi:hypothetical protein
VQHGTSKRDFPFFSREHLDAGIGQFRDDHLVQAVGVEPVGQRLRRHPTHFDKHTWKPVKAHGVHGQGLS